MSDMIQFKNNIPTVIFLLIESVLYYLILTAGGSLLVWSSYLSIVICFVYALIHWRTGNPFLIAGLACTVAADFCLVVCTPIQQLYGMLAFLAAQTMYAIMLYRGSPNQKLLASRGILTVVAVATAILILEEKTDALALVSICYYANLIMNTIAAFTQFRHRKLFPIGLVLFILCDTVIGLQVASGAYLPIGEHSLLYRIIFCGFNLAWLFYLPSQVLIALSCRKSN